MREITTNYTQTKDAYEGNREFSTYQDSPLPPSKKPNKNSYDDGNIPDVDLPGGEGNVTSTEPLPESVRPRKDGLGGE